MFAYIDVAIIKKNKTLYNIIIRLLKSQFRLMQTVLSSHLLSFIVLL